MPPAISRLALWSRPDTCPHVPSPPLTSRRHFARCRAPRAPTPCQTPPLVLSCEAKRLTRPTSAGRTRGGERRKTKLKAAAFCGMPGRPLFACLLDTRAGSRLTAGSDPAERLPPDPAERLSPDPAAFCGMPGRLLSLPTASHARAGLAAAFRPRACLTHPLRLRTNPVTNNRDPAANCGMPGRSLHAATSPLLAGEGSGVRSPDPAAFCGMPARPLQHRARVPWPFRVGNKADTRCQPYAKGGDPL
jgi:hypothetical protein